MKTCKNIKSKKYTGKENTPLGRGYHASVEKLNKKMKGKDGSIYRVIKTKKGKRWQKISSTGRTKRGDPLEEIKEACKGCNNCYQNLMDIVVEYKKNLTIVKSCDLLDDDLVDISKKKVKCNIICKDCENKDPAKGERIKNSLNNLVESLFLNIQYR